MALLVAIGCVGCADGSGRGAPAVSDDPVREVRPVAVLGALEIRNPRVPAPAIGDRVSLYAIVENTGTAPDTLTGLSTAGGSGGSLHRSEVRDGTASMVPVGPQTAPPGGYLVLEPGGLHGMLTGLTTLLVPGDTVEVTLTFARAGSVAVRVPVISYADLTSERVDRPGR